jgi:hypothetical protein
VNEHQTALLSERLHRLADEMTPQLDVVTHVRTARARHRRRRRARVVLLTVATATAAVVIGTTTAVDLLTAGRGEVAAPGVPSAGPSASPTVDEARPPWLEGQVESLAMSLEMRPADLELRAPAGLSGCPGLTTRLVDALDISLEQEPASTSGGADECTWIARTGPAGTISLSIGFVAGGDQHTVRENLAGSLLDDEDEAAGSASRSNECYTTPLPGYQGAAGLRACAFGAREAWAVDIADAGGHGVWVLTATVPFGLQSVNALSSMVTLIDLADQTW